MVEQQNPTPDQPNSRSWVSRQLVRLRALFQRDVIVAQVGEGAENVAVGKNIFQINVGGHNITPYLLALIGVTLVVVGFLTWPLVEPTLYPARMASGFNIAVADVGLLRGDGSMAPSDFGDAISQSMFATIDGAYADALAADAPIAQQVLVWHDSLGRARGKNLPIGYVAGKTEAERAENAAALAQDFGADMLIYGHLTDETDPESVVMEFYYDRQAKAGEADPVWGNYALGRPISAGIAYAANPGSARQLVDRQLQPRAEALFWMTQGLAYQLIDLPEEALQVLEQAEQKLTAWPEDQGKEVLYLFLGQAALLARDFDKAIAYAEKADTVGQGYPPAQMLKGMALYDRAQLFPYRERPIPPEQLAAACITVRGVEHADGDLDAAIASTDAAIVALEKALAQTPSTERSTLRHRIEQMLGNAYRLRGQWRFNEHDLAAEMGEAAIAAAMYAQAQVEFDQAEQYFRAALAGFPAETQPVYHAWTLVGLGTLDQLRGFLALRQEGQAAALPWLEESVSSYQACVDLRDDVQGNLVFLNKVLGCSCVYYRDVVQGIISDTVQVQSVGGNP